MSEVINWLLANGWTEAGETNISSVRIPTRNSPLYGKSGGEVAYFGGRRRFSKGDWFVTVGKRTTFFYQVENHEPRNSQAVKSCLAEVRGVILGAL